jgi:hypothetical protein
MAGAQRGRVISGLFNFPGVGTGTTKFFGDFVGFDDSLSTSNKNRAGRQSTNKWRRVRPLLNSGKIVINFLVNTEGYATPDVWRGQEGSLTITYASGKTKTVSVRAVEAAFALKKRDDTDIKGTLLCEVIGNPTLTGFGGTQPTSTEPSASDEEQWAGTQKLHDPSGLVTTARRRIDVWGSLANTDAAEADRMAQVIASYVSTPLQYTKLRTAMFVRDSDDGGEVVLDYGLTTTEEDAINPQEHTTNDDYGLVKTAQRAVFNGTPPTREYNDQKILSVRTFGNRDTKDDHEYPGTFDNLDPLELLGTAQITRVTQSPTLPTGIEAPLGYLVSTHTEQLDRNPGNWKHVLSYAHINSHQRVTFPQDLFGDDPSNLEDFDRQAIVSEDSTAPTAPDTRITGLVLRKVQTHRVGGLPALYLHVWEFGRRTTEQDITIPGTVTSQDVSELADEATIKLVTGTSAIADPVPTAPLGQYVGHRVVGIHTGSDGEKWEHTYLYANTTNAQKITFAGTVATDDPSDLTNQQTYTTLTATSAAPEVTYSGLKLRRVETKRIAGVPEQWQHDYLFGLRSTEEDITMPGTVTQPDSENIGDKATVTIVNSSTSPGSPPPAPLGQFIGSSTEQLHGSTDGARWKHTFEYGNNTSVQDIVFPLESKEDDPNNLADHDTRATVTGSSTPPSAGDFPTRIAGLKLRWQRTVRRGGTPEKWLHVWHYTRTTTTEDVTLPATQTYTDVDNVGDRATICVVNTSSTSGDPPAAPVGQYIGKESTQLHDGTDAEAWKHVFHYQNTTNVQKIEFSGTVTTVDVGASLEDKAVITDVTDDSGMPTHPAPELTKLVFWEVKRLQGTPEKWEHRLIYGKRTTQEAREMDGSAIVDDPADIADQQIFLLVQATSAVTLPTTPTGLKLREVVTKQLFDVGDTERWEHKITYARTDRADDIVFDASWFEPDVNALKSTAAVAVINGNESPPSLPPAPVPGVKWISTRTKQIHDASDGEKWVHVFRYGVRTPKEDIEWLQSKRTRDAVNIRPEAIEVRVTSDSTPAASNTVNPDTTNLTLWTVTTHRETDTSYIHVFHFRPFDPEEEIEHGGSRATTDPVSFMVADDIRVVVSNNETESDPGVSGQVCIRRVTKKISRTDWEHTFHYAFRSLADQLLADQTRSVYDIGLLNNSAVTAAVYASTPDDDPEAPTDPTGLTLVEYEDRPTANPDWTLRIYRWGRETSTQKVINGTWVAEADNLDLNRRTESSIITVADSVTPSDYVDSVIGTYRTDPMFRTLRAKKLSPTQILLLKEKLNEDKLLKGGGSSSRAETVKGVPTGGYGNAAASCLCIPPGPPILIGGYNRVTIIPTAILRATSRFTFRRIYATNQPYNYQYLAIRGHVNNAAFLGHDAYEVMYQGAEIMGSFDISGTRLFVIDYEFTTDNAKHFIDAYLPIGDVSVAVGLIDQIGFFPHTRFVTSGLGAAWPPSADFSGFGATNVP